MEGIKMQNIIEFLVSSIDTLGYLGIILLMLLESSFIPFPSEVVMIPAGYLISKGEMSTLYVLCSGLLGSIAGAWLNYFIALKFGRGFLLKIISKENMNKMDMFFQKHGHISTFTGRLIPVVRQYISFPAGLTKMNGLKFTIYTTAGALIWIILLTLLGYFIGDNQNLVQKYLKDITNITIIVVSLILLIYIKIKRVNKEK